jgi:hypothetical protein
MWLPELSISIGGATSIDITHKGVGKGHGLKRLRNVSGIPFEQMVFIGDAIFPGGNDYSAKELRLETLQVENLYGTLDAITGLDFRTRIVKERRTSFFHDKSLSDILGGPAPQHLTPQSRRLHDRMIKLSRFRKSSHGVRNEMKIAKYIVRETASCEPELQTYKSGQARWP